MKKDDNHLLTMVSILLICIAIIICFLLTSKKTNITDKKEDEIISTLICEVNGNADSFFVSKMAKTVDQELKITYKDETLDKFFYSFKGVYSSNADASADETNLHAKYNIYMGDNNTSQEILSPSYSIIGNKFHLNLFADGDNDINEVTAVFFFLENNELDMIKNYSIIDLKKLYEDKGLECAIME